MKVVLAASLAIACSQPATPPAVQDPRPPPAHVTPRAGAVTISIIGTNDLHGALVRLPLLAGFIANVRAARAADGGGVLLVDAGDLFQGTLESNLGEGADVVRAYNQMGYAAAAVGNHEFDYGPEGPAVIATAGEDPRGALKARALAAKFPFLVSNIVDEHTGARIDWPNMPASTRVEVAGVAIGLIGVSTESTPYKTMPANFVGLRVTPPAAAIAAEATRLRADGVKLVVVVAHLGSKCSDLDHPDDASSCDHQEELFKLLADLPHGLVDVIVAGHTHAGVAHRIDGVAIIESFSSGRAFGRVDVQFSADGHISDSKIFRPRDLCALDHDGNPVAVSSCKPGDYEGRPVVADAAVTAIVDEALARAGQRRKEPLGVTLTATVTKSYDLESAEGDLMCDLMLAARPDAQVALTNGGGLRADLPAGQLTYGALYEAIPFDNRFATVDLSGAQLRTLVTRNLQHGAGIFSWGGLTAKARCKSGSLAIDIAVGGKPLIEHAQYKVITSDFLASGGDGAIGRLKLPTGAIQVSDMIMRDAFADLLRKQAGQIDPAKRFALRRLDYEGARPLRCGKTTTDEETP